jgi:hypothetical protein
MSVHYKLDAKTLAVIASQTDIALDHARKCYEGNLYESVYYDAIIAEIKRRKELSE